jgi:hypothetical protein
MSVEGPTAARATITGADKPDACMTPETSQVTDVTGSINVEAIRAD